MSSTSAPAAKRGFVHRHPKHLDHLLRLPQGGETTMYELLMNSFAKFPKQRALGTRTATGPFEWITYADLEQRVLRFAAGLSELGLKRGESIGCYSQNREEAVVTELAAWCRTFTTVYLYDTLGDDSTEYITNHASVAFLVCSPDKAERVLALAPKCPKLRCLVVMGGGGVVATPVGSKVRVVSFGDVLRIGGQVIAQGPHPASAPQPPAPRDVLTILYTSGTTGPPKGVVITHAAFVSAVAASQVVVGVNSDDSLLSYLPMAHVFEKILQAMTIASGAHMGFYRGDPKLLIEDVGELKPTIFAGVPRVYQKVYDRVNNQIATSSWVKRKLFEAAYSTKKANRRAGGTSADLPWWVDGLIFSKIKERLGGRVRLIVSGAAPLSAELHEFLEVCFCAPVVQGYGLSETCAVTSVSDQSLWGRAEGHVGFPAPENEIVLESVPEMNYSVEDKPCPRGEILIRGPNVFSGYFGEPQKTAEVMTADGFFCTGDIGQWNPNGTLSIIDRKKNIFKLAQGEYIAVEKLEQLYVRSPYVAQVWVYGNSERDHLVAVVVPDPETLLPWAKTSDLREACARPEAEALVVGDLNRMWAEAKLAGFERVFRVHLEPVEWTPECDLMTPTMKTSKGVTF
jgi:long-chain acyl-CoA synthetase